MMKPRRKRPRRRCHVCNQSSRPTLALAMKEKTMESNDIQTDAEFSSAERDAVYKCIFNRRDVRGQFLPNPIPDQVLARLLNAARVARRCLLVKRRSHRKGRQHLRKHSRSFSTS